MATGFDAMTGALLHVDIKGKNNCTLKRKWKNGPKTYLGISSQKFSKYVYGFWTWKSFCIN